MSTLSLKAWLYVLNILFHNFDVDLIVEVDDVLLVAISESNLQIDTLDASLVLVLEDISILIYHIVEGYLEFWLDLAHAVDCAHHQLI